MSVSQRHPIPRLGFYSSGVQRFGSQAGAAGQAVVSGHSSTSLHQLQQQHQHLLQLHLSGAAAAAVETASSASSSLAMDLNGYDQAIQDLTESLNEVRVTASLALQESQLVREQMQQGILSVLSELTAMWCQDIYPQPAVDFAESVAAVAAAAGGSGSVRSPEQDQRTNFRYKTQLCKNYMASSGDGRCTKGEACQYAHGRQELRRICEHPRYKTKMCSLQASLGVCPHGAACFFAHHSGELRAREV